MYRLMAWWRSLANSAVDPYGEREWRAWYAEGYESRIAASTRSHGNVSLQQEGEAWRSTLCHGPNDCSS